MAGMIFFTDNYQDRSTNDGYQFEFYCRHCGNGYSSSFQHSVTGFGGRLLRLGGDLVGGAVGERAQQLGWDAGCGRTARLRSRSATGGSCSRRRGPACCPSRSVR